MLEVAVQKRIEDYESVKRWITRRNKRSGTPNTRRTYLHWIRRFCEYAGKNPNELIEERKEDLKSMPEQNERRLEKTLRPIREIPNTIII